MATELTQSHLSEELLAAFAVGHVPGATTEHAQAHLTSCHECQALLSAWDLIARTGGLPSALAEAVPGERIGPYEVRARLGAGAMGVVYRAFDPSLERDVALKLLSTKTERGDAHERAVREARALAKIDHPNIVRVYEVGAHQGCPYIAMEFVKGQTLAGWLATPRSVADVLQAFLAAGTGLARAHEEGLVHRDFKPANVMVADDGRVLLMDFGLAEHQWSRPTVSGSSSHTSPQPPVEVAGTPAYMAPELLRGDVATAASDQFSYCVALFRALYEHAPFAGTSWQALADNVSRGALAAPSKRRGPAHVFRAIARGLSPQPAARFATMHALLRELARDPWQRVRRVATGMTLLLGVLLASTGVWLARAGHQLPCGTYDDAWSNSWNTRVKDGLRQMFQASLVPLGADAWTRIEREMDGYVASWKSARRTVCLREHNGDVSNEVARAQVDCLMAAHARAERTAATLRADSPAAAAASVVDAVSLPSVKNCLSPNLPTAVAPPARWSERVVHWALKEEIESARRTKRETPIAEQEVVVEALLQQARAAGRWDALMPALSLAADLRERSGKYHEAAGLYEEAIQLAVSAGRDDKAASGWLKLSALYVMRMNDLPAAKRWLALAEASNARKPMPEFDNDVWLLKASIAKAEGDFAAAEAAYRQLIEVRTRDLGPTNEAVAMATINLSQLLASSQRHADALVASQEAVGILEARFGPAHPILIGPLATMGGHLRQTNASEAARQAYDRAYALITTYEPDSVHLGAVLNSRGTLALDAGQYDVALQSFREARAFFTKRFGETSSRILPMIDNEALALREAGRLEEALATHVDVLRLATEALPANHPDLIGYLQHAGETGLLARDMRQAHSHFQDAARIAHLQGDAARPRLTQIYYGLAVASQGLNRRNDAKQHFEQAIAAREANTTTDELARIQFDFATFLADHDRTGANDHALQAMALLVDAAPKPSYYAGLEELVKKTTPRKK